MRLPTHLRRIAVILPLVLGTTLFPVVGGRPVSVPHHWRLAVSTPAMTLKAPDDFGLVGVAWPADSAPPTGVKVRTSTDGSRWGAWQDLDYEVDFGPDGGAAVRSTDPLWTGRSRFVDVRFKGSPPKGASVHLIDPGPDPTTPRASAIASPARPGIITRAQWGADESMRRAKPSYAEPIKLAIIHHTATSDAYGKSESAKIVRSIYAYHVQTNGWDDIGYNFIVDKYGQIFEGRYGGVSRTVVGAHSKGFNRYTAGIATLGTFQSRSPTSTMKQALTRLTAWRLDRGFVDPNGTTTYVSGGSDKFPSGQKVKLKNVTSHRDVGTTACPGDPIYNSLPSLRSGAAAYGDPKLYAPRFSTNAMTPNGDGVADTVTLSGRFSSSVSWRVDVLDRDSKVWATRKGSGTSLSATWNGKNGSGQTAPHDAYRFRITGKNGSGTVGTTNLMMNVWHYPNGSLLRASSGWTAHLQGGKLRPFRNNRAMLTQYTSAERISVSNDLSRVYRVGRDIGFRNGSILRADEKLWFISDGRRRPVSQATLDALGFSRDAIIDTTAGALAPHALGAEMLAADGHPNGSALFGSNTQEALVGHGSPRPFITRNARVSWRIRDMDMAGPADDQIAQATLAAPLPFRDGTLVRAEGRSEVYVITDRLRRHITSGHRLDVMGYQRSNIRPVSAAELALHQEGQPL